jgi:hypothetical protein
MPNSSRQLRSLLVVNCGIVTLKYQSYELSPEGSRPTAGTVVVQSSCGAQWQEARGLLTYLGPAERLQAADAECGGTALSL